MHHRKGMLVHNQQNAYIECVSVNLLALIRTCRHVHANSQPTWRWRRSNYYFYQSFKPTVAPEKNVLFLTKYFVFRLSLSFYCKFIMVNAANLSDIHHYIGGTSFVTNIRPVRWKRTGRSRSLCRACNGILTCIQSGVLEIK